MPIRRKPKPQRRLQLESLESRQLLNVDWRNPVDALDANQDQQFNINDPLEIIRDLKRNGQRVLAPTRPSSAPYVDVDGDGSASINDALQCIRLLRRGAIPTGVRSLQEGTTLFSETSLTVTLGQPAGTRTYRLGLSATFDATATPAPDRVNVYLVNPTDASTTLLDRGVSGTSLFSLTRTGAEAIPGLSSWDGSVLSLDLTRASGETGILVVQLMSGDVTNATQVTVTPLSNVVDPLGTPPVFIAQSSIAPGSAVNLTGYQSVATLTPAISNVRFDIDTGFYEADLRLTNAGPALDAAAIVAFAGLPLGVTLQNASGTTGDARPYVNLAPAVTGLSLDNGETTSAVKLQFADPTLLRFSFTLDALGKSSAPLVLGSIPTLTVNPGRSIEVPLTASGGVAGLPLTYTVDITNLPAGLPTGKIEGQGKLSFAPLASETGTYHFEVLVSNGQQTSRRNVTLNVLPDAEISTRLHGFVRNTQQQPLAGVRVSMPGAADVFTAADGSFTLDFGGAVPAANVDMTIHGAALGQNYISLIINPYDYFQQRSLIAGERSDFVRPFYLAQIDVANGVTINPAVETIVTNPNLPGVSFTIPANSLFRASDGQPFTGQVYLTEIPVDATTVALTDSGTVVRIDFSEEATTTGQGTLIVPNDDGYAEDDPDSSVFPLKSDPKRNLWGGVGGGSATPSANQIPMRLPFITGEYKPRRNRTVRTQEKIPDPRDKNKKPHPCDEVCKGKSEIELHSGSFNDEFDLVPYQAQGAARGLSFVYTGEWADARPIVALSLHDYDNRNPAVLARDPSTLRLHATLETFVGNFSIQASGIESDDDTVRDGTNFWKVQAYELGHFNTIQAAISMQLDLRGVPTGVYPRQSFYGGKTLGENGWSGPSEVNLSSLMHVNESQSPFGAGWSIAGLQRLIPAGDDLLLIDGNGISQVFYGPGPVFNAIEVSDGDFTRMERLGDNTYRRTWPDQTIDRFDAAGRIVSSTDRNGNAFRYEYDGAGRLVKWIDPVNLETILTYTGLKLSSVTDPVGRVTRFTHDAAGNLTEIEHPNTAKLRYGYDEMHRIVSEIDERGALSTVQYGPGGRASGEILPAYTTPGGTDTLTVNPLQTQQLGAFESGATRDPVNSPLASTDLSYQVTRSGQGLTQTVTLDRSGQGTETTDSLGILSRTEYDSNNLVVEFRDGGFNNTREFSYNRHGNLVSATDSFDQPEYSEEFPAPVDSISGDAFNVILASDVTALASLPLTFEVWANATVSFGLTAVVEDNLISNSTAAFGSELDGYGIGIDTNLHPGDGYPPGLGRTNSGITVRTPGGGSHIIPIEMSSGTPFPEGGGWRHYAVVYTPGNARFYLDGELLAEFSYTQSAAPVPTTLAIAKNFRGYMDEVRIWNVARTEAEIQRDMTRQMQGNEPGLTNYFPFTNVAYEYSDDPVLVPGVDHGPGAAPTTFQRRIYPSSTSVYDTRHFTYDSKFQQLTSATDTLGHQTFFTIDPTNGNTLSATRVVGALGGADDLVTTFTYIASGLVDTVTDPLGRVTDFDYDSRERLTSVTYAKATPDQGIWQYEYDNAGNVTAVIDPLGRRTEYEYNLMNWLLKVTRPDPDAAGPLSSPVSQMAYSIAGDLLSTTDALNHTTQMQYDVRGAVKQVTDAQGGVTTYVRNAAGNVTSMKDPLNRETRYVYDARQRMIQSIDPDNLVTQFEYDNLDNLAAVIDPKGNRTTMLRDGRGRLQVLRDAFGREETFDYDTEDRLISRTDRNGRQIDYAYDDLNRLVSETWVAGGNVIEFDYDKLGNLLSATDAFSALGMTYDARNRLVEVDNNLTPGVPRVEVQYAYDAASRVTELEAFREGSAIVANGFSYDDLDRVLGITQSGSAVSEKSVGFTYNALGQFSSISRFGNLAATQLVATTDYGYDTRNRLTSLTHKNAASVTLNFETLVYDAADRMTKITTVDGVTDYAYDDRDQLTGATHADAANPDETYAYDENGNRVSSSRHGVGYQTGTNNQLLSDGTFNYAYDNEGNLTRRTEIATSKVRDFTWDFRNRLTTISDKQSVAGTETQRVDFTYDAFNRRISKTVTAGASVKTTHFVYTGANVLFDFVDADGPGGVESPELCETYLHGPAIDQILAQDDGAEIDWFLADHLGTITDLVDNAGAVVNHLKYDSYGNPISQSNSAEGTRYGFTGRELDAETGLYYYRARYYDAAIGRFLSEDTIGFDGGDVNLYSYVGNSPIGFVDPTGNAGIIAVNFYTGNWGSARHAELLIYEPSTGQIITEGGDKSGWDYTGYLSPNNLTYHPTDRVVLPSPKWLTPKQLIDWFEKGTGLKAKLVGTKDICLKEASKRISRTKQEIDLNPRTYSALPALHPNAANSNTLNDMFIKSLGLTTPAPPPGIWTPGAALAPAPSVRPPGVPFM